MSRRRSESESERERERERKRVRVRPREKVTNASRTRNENTKPHGNTYVEREATTPCLSCVATYAHLQTAPKTFYCSVCYMVCKVEETIVSTAVTGDRGKSFPSSTRNTYASTSAVVHLFGLPL